MDIGHPGFVITRNPARRAGTVLGLEGALRAVDTEPDAWPDATRGPFQTALAAIVNTPWRLATAERMATRSSRRRSTAPGTPACTR